MKAKRRQRLLLILFFMVTLAIALGLVLFALRQNISLFYTPTQLVAGEVPVLQPVRVGGLVVKGSVSYSADGQRVSFALTDTRHQLTVTYRGLLPDLFREGQGIVAQGQLNKSGQFVASQVLAKHDENYRPPEVTAALKAAS